MKPFEFRRNHFDLIRLVAALQVAFVHGCQHLGVELDSTVENLIELFPGVPIFFVISGFLISASAERSTSLASYLQNRVLRIYPGLWACFFFSVIAATVVFRPSYSWAEFVPWVVAQLSVGQFYNPGFLREFGVGVLNGSLWTIPIEIQFYFILPIIYAWLNRTRLSAAALFVAMLGLVAINQAYIASAMGSESLILKLFGVTILPYLYIFMIGVFLQRHQSFVADYLAGRASIWMIAYLTVAACAYGFGATSTGNYLNPVSALVLCLLTISAGYSFTGGGTGVLGGNDVSYGIYIYHMVIVNVLLHLDVLPPTTNLAVMFATTIALAFLSWKFVEKPALTLKSYSIKSAEVAVPVSGPLSPE